MIVFPNWTQLIFLGFFSFILVKATDITIRALNRLSRTFKIGAFGLTAFLLALATSLPELFVSLVSAVEGTQNMALGVILGSNIANVSLVIGGAALIGGSMAVVGDFLRRDIFYSFLAATLPLLLLLAKTLSRVDGLILLTVYLAFNFIVLRGKPLVAELSEQGALVRRFFRRMNQGAAEKQYGWLFFGVALLLFSADMIVRAASHLAGTFGLPNLFIGLVFVAIGTTLPELFFEIEAIRQHRISMVLGNLLGSLVVNSTLILGVTVLIRPIELDGGFRSYLLATVAFLVIFNLFWFFVRTKKRLERWEAGILTLAYLLFVLIEFWQSKRL